MISFYFNTDKTYFQILEQDEKVLKYVPYRAKNGVSINSVSCPALYNESELFLRGTSKDSDLNKVNCSVYNMFTNIIPALFELWNNDECKIKVKLK